MLGRLAAVAVCVSLAACAGLEPAGRNAARSPQPSRPAPPPVSAPATPPPAPAAALPQPAPSRPAPPPAATTPAPTPALTVPPQAQPIAPPRPVAAPATPPTQAAPPPPTTPARAPVLTPQNSGDDIVVPGQREQQVLPPNGDPRSNAERMQDIRAWDRCVTTVQAAYERDPMRPQMDTPEEYCARSLGMADRGSIPLSRQEQRR